MIIKILYKMYKNSQVWKYNKMIYYFILMKLSGQNYVSLKDIKNFKYNICKFQIVSINESKYFSYELRDLNGSNQIKVAKKEYLKKIDSSNLILL